MNNKHIKKHYILIRVLLILLLVSCGVRARRQLFQAAENGDIKTVQKLINEGVDVNSLHYDRILDTYIGRTPLMIAAYKGHNDIIRLLLKSGAEVNKLSRPLKETAVLKAARAGNLETVKILVLAGADLTLANRFGRTPLMYAVKSGYTEVARYLILQGSDIQARDEDGLTALDFARKQKNNQLIRILKAE